MRSVLSQVKPSGRKANDAVRGKHQQLHCLITGFDAFAEQSFNPSQVIVEALPASFKLSGRDSLVNVAGLVLPTCGELAWKKLKAQLEKLPRKSKSVVILTGVAGFRSNITVERFALNIRDYRVKDNAGHVILAKRIDRSGPEALRTLTKVEDLVDHIRRQGLTAEVSNFCGTFVCNEIYYQGLRFQKTKQIPDALVFVHVPLPAQYGKHLRKSGKARFQKLAAGKANQLLAMHEAVMEIARYLCRQVISDT
jgi:pyroglutamyl-peptidase